MPPTVQPPPSRLWHCQRCQDLKPSPGQGSSAVTKITTTVDLSSNVRQVARGMLSNQQREDKRQMPSANLLPGSGQIIDTTFLRNTEASTTGKRNVLETVPKVQGNQAWVDRRGKEYTSNTYAVIRYVSLAPQVAFVGRTTQEKIQILQITDRTLWVHHRTKNNMRHSTPRHYRNTEIKQWDWNYHPLAFRYPPE